MKCANKQTDLKKKPVPGDMVRIKRRLYSHWGICVSKHDMVHLSPPGENHEVNMIKSLGVSMPVQVTISKMEDVACGNEYYADNYLDGEEGFNPRPTREICAYAMGHLEEPEQDFDLVWNNCEKFAIMCRYREYHPGKQAERGIIASVATAAGLVAASATTLIALLLFK